MSRKTIRDAVKKLPKEQAELLIRAFNATKVMDIYDGNLIMYLKIIIQTLDKQREKMHTMKSASHTIKSILEANF